MKNKGITLVALVITIIILLILAGITITQLTQSGLFEKTQLAKEKYEKSQKNEENQMNEMEEIIENISGCINETLEKYGFKDPENLTNWIENLDSISTEDKSNKQILKEIINNKNIADYIITDENIINALVNSECAMSELGNSEYLGYKAITDDSFKNKILTSEYVKEFDKGSTSVPILENDNEQIIYSSYYSGQYPYEAFDNNDYTAWGSSAWDTNGFIGYDFKKNVIVYKVEIVNCGDSYGYRENFLTANIQYYDNESATYANASEIQQLKTDENSIERQILYPTQNFISSKWILRGYSSIGGKYLSCRTVQFYAREIPQNIK